MVLDPVTALAVAGNVVQFVDFSFKLVSKANEFHEHGSLLQHKHLRQYAQQIKDFNSLLETRLKGFQDKAADKAQDPVTRLLRLALDHCNESAAELLDATQRLTVAGSNSRWQSFRHALSSIMGENGLQMTTQRLSQAQQNVVLFLILYTSSTQTNTGTVLQSNFSLEKNILFAVNQSISGIKEQIEALRKNLGQIETSKVDSFTKACHDENAELFDTVGFNVSSALPIVAREKFLRTLNFERINDRYDRIAPAHKQTLQWVLEPSALTEVAWDNFPSWLGAKGGSDNLYWITGKPGSGKSTLMRYLADSDRTSEIISSWAAPDPFQVLKCFFWNPGSVMQRSMKGLLRTLTHQALSHDDADYDVIQAISPLRWHSCMYDRNPVEDWSLSELTVLLRSMVTVLSKKMKLMFFVDGLDEFGTDRGERETLVKLFLDLRPLPNIKMCLSSRPWNEFKDSFGAFPHLRLEDLTRQDMRDFAESELGNSRALQDLASVAKDRVHELQEQLVMKSNGVFLWLFLVTKRLRLAAQDGKQLRKLFEILDQMPPDLDEFFQHMLKRIPSQDRVQASRIFQIMLDGGPNPLATLMTLSFTDEDAVDFALIEALKAETQPEILSRTVALRRRLDSQCMDLLVCAPPNQGDGESWDNTQVEYLHRTVKEFLETKTSQELLLSYNDVPLDVPWYKCNAAIVQMMFMNKFIPHWSISDYNQQRLQVHRFQECLQRFWCYPNMCSASAKQVFELAVAQIDPLMKGKPLGINRRVFSREGSRAYLAEQVCRAYQRPRYLADHPYLVMALIGGFTKYADSYIADLQEGSMTLPYFRSALVWALWTDEPPDPTLLLRIVERGHLFKAIDAAFSAMDEFHDNLQRLMPAQVADFSFQESCSKVTKMLVQRTEGLSASEVQLQNLYDCWEMDIRMTFHHLIAASLIQHLQKTRKTWITTKRDQTISASAELVQTRSVSPQQAQQAPRTSWTPRRPPTPDPDLEPRVVSSIRRPPPAPAASRKKSSWIKAAFSTKH